MVSKLDQQTYTSESESHWVPFSYCLVPHLSKKLSKLLKILKEVQFQHIYKQESDFIERLKFEFTHYDFIVLLFNHNATRKP